MPAVLTSKTKFTGIVDAHTLRDMFNVDKLTILNWRRRKEDPLPTIIIPGGKQYAVRFNLGEVRKWAKRNDKQIQRTFRARTRFDEG